MNNPTLWRIGFPLILTLNLTGCFLIEKPFQLEPDWNPPTLSKEGCPNIEGEYKNVLSGEATLYRVFSFYVKPGSKTPLSQVQLIPPKHPPADVLELKVLKDRRLSLMNHQRTLEEGKELQEVNKQLSEQYSKQVARYNSPENVQLRKKREEEYKQSHVRIERQGETLEVTLHTVADNPPEYKMVLDLSHPLAGCYRGALLMRVWSPWSSSVEFGPSTMPIWEFKFRKLPDGMLEVQRGHKYWLNTSFGEPRYSEQHVYLFPPVP